MKKMSKEEAEGILRENAKLGLAPFVIRAGNEIVSDGESSEFYEGFCSGLGVALKTIEEDADDPEKMKYFLGEVLAQAAWFFLGEPEALGEELEKYF